MKTLRLALFLTLALSACSMPPPSPAPLGSDRDSPTNFDVQSISFVDSSADHPPIAPVPNEQFDPPISRLVRIWASTHLAAVGTSGQGILTLKNAYVTQQALPVNSSGWFDRPQASQYVGHVDVQFEIQGNHTYALATASAMHSITLPEHPTADEKQAAYGTMVDGLMQDLSHYFQQAVHEHMNDSIVTAPVLGTVKPPVILPEISGRPPQ